jgi:hypothetical protein
MAATGLAKAGAWYPNPTGGPVAVAFAPTSTFVASEAFGPARSIHNGASPVGA